MRYLSDAGAYDEHTIALAETLFERFVGRVIATHLHDERITLRNHRGRLTYAPIVRIEKVSARIDGSSVVLWSLDDVIAPSDVVIDHGGHVLLPSSLFGEPYTTAHITYLAGYEPIPDDVTMVVDEIARLVAQGVMDEWSGEQALSDEARATIARYRR